MKRVAILQSNYIPWKGYFDLINSVDLFIFHDDLQYTKNDWRNRNKIKTMEGVRWVTIPSGTNEKRLIHEVTLCDSLWQKKHWNLIKTITKNFLGNKNTQFDDSRKYNLKEKKEARVLELLEKVGASEYISGPAAKSYISEQNFIDKNINLTWFDYVGYKPYEQLGQGFVHDVSIIDVLFNCGPEALLYTRGKHEQQIYF